MCVRKKYQHALNLFYLIFIVSSFFSQKNAKALECPLSQKDTVGQFNVPTSKIIDSNLILGEALFGIGWGIAGLCPGPAMFLAFAGYPNVLFRFWPSFFVGSYLAEQLKMYQIRAKATPSTKKD